MAPVLLLLTAFPTAVFANMIALLKLVASKAGFFPPSQCLKEKSWCISTRLILGEIQCYVCVHVPRCMCEGRSCMRKGMFLKKEKWKLQPLRSREEMRWEGEQKNICCCLKDPCSQQRELSGKMFTLICFYLRAISKMKKLNKTWYFQESEQMISCITSKLMNWNFMYEFIL